MLKIDSIKQCLIQMILLTLLKSIYWENELRGKLKPSEYSKGCHKIYDLWALHTPYNLKFWYARKSRPHDSISQISKP